MTIVINPQRASIKPVDVQKQKKENNSQKSLTSTSSLSLVRVPISIKEIRPAQPFSGIENQKSETSRPPVPSSISLEHVANFMKGLSSLLTNPQNLDAILNKIDLTKNITLFLNKQESIVLSPLKTLTSLLSGHPDQKLALLLLQLLTVQSLAQNQSSDSEKSLTVTETSSPYNVSISEGPQVTSPGTIEEGAFLTSLFNLQTFISALVAVVAVYATKLAISYLYKYLNSEQPVNPEQPTDEYSQRENHTSAEHMPNRQSIENSDSNANSRTLLRVEEHVGPSVVEPTTIEVSTAKVSAPAPAPTIQPPVPVVPAVVAAPTIEPPAPPVTATTVVTSPSLAPSLAPTIAPAITVITPPASPKAEATDFDKNLSAIDNLKF